ncbi:2OG-Fe(II) oxygenase [Gloeocapsa sp. PCC 73106]|uniref:2OG-Fe(II) oxygenase n=1 Tax=Gloeocapsa sp. PCC 73106 TaxID=102232 RepID=UPI0002ACDD65|nr:2OG-Fe(II) oxygenase [Gloeocapsa sp. PCC 73106]ELR97882.1 putative iron-regulated protein [Gloeocapsa sp. PCC 73106]
MLTIGEPAPWFSCASSTTSQFNFQTIAGRYVVLCFYGSATVTKNAKVLDYLTNDLRHFFDDEHICFFGVTIDYQDREIPRVSQNLPGIRYFWDFDAQVSMLYGAIPSKEVLAQTQIQYNSFTLILDPSLRTIYSIPIDDAEKHNQAILAILSELPGVNEHAGVSIYAPVLTVPRIFERSFCRQLIALYEQNGGSESGFMREQEGKTVGVIDYSFKRRQDYNIDYDTGTEEICSEIRSRIVRRLIPEIEKAYQFKVTRMERYLIACYDGASGGFFRPHRDNTTKATAHRRFACTINLNAEEYDGGDLRFPEFGDNTYRAPTGGAVVFSCSLLHEATSVTKGKRYAFLPFFYDEEAAKIRSQNAHFLSNEVINKN